MIEKVCKTSIACDANQFRMVLKGLGRFNIWGYLIMLSNKIIKIEHPVLTFATVALSHPAIFSSLTSVTAFTNSSISQIQAISGCHVLNISNEVVS